MALTEEIRSEIEAVVHDERTLEDLRVWLAEHVQEVADLQNSEVENTADQAWMVLAEWFDGHRDEASTRGALAALIAAHAEADTADGARQGIRRA